VIDLLIVGGGPAGLATALYATRAGLETVVAEPRATPIDKACGEGLMPSAVRALDGLGVRPPGRPIRGIRYLDGSRSVAADFRRGVGLGTRRTDLHAALAAAVAAAGVPTITCRVDGVRQDTTSVHAAGLRARYLVAADGLHSTVRRQVGLCGGTDARRRWGIRAHFATAPWTDHVEVYWSPHAEAYVTPVGADCVGVAVLTATRADFARQLRGFPALAARLPDRPASGVLAAGPLRQLVRARTSGRVLLVGDAAGYVDALTGEGLALAFASAAELVACARADDPAAYEARWRQVTRRYRLITSALLAAGAHDRLRRGIVPAAAGAPWLFRTAVDQLAR
jgi:flavin-dependent dehydrogenase